jgi:hypothetical protein
LIIAVRLVAGWAVVDGRVPPTSSGPAAVTLPARPRDVPIDGVEPCSLLTEQQRSELGLDGRPSSSTASSALFGGDEPACVVRGFTPRAVSVGVGVVTTAGIELFTSGKLDATVTAMQVQGFPAVVAIPTRFTDYCSVFVDVAPGQLLDIQFADGGRKPPIPQGQLCRDAGRVADATMRTLLVN